MKTFRRLTRHWLAFLNLLWVVYAGLPWLAPLLMHVGAGGAGRVIYIFYRTQCHLGPIAAPGDRCGSFFQ